MSEGLTSENQEDPTRKISEPIREKPILEEKNTREFTKNTELKKETFEYYGPQSLKNTVAEAITNCNIKLSRTPKIEVGLFGVDYSGLGFKDEAAYFAQIDSLVLIMDDLRKDRDEAFGRRIDEDKESLSRAMDSGSSEEALKVITTKGEDEKQIEERLLEFEEGFRNIADSDQVNRKSISLEMSIEELEKLKNITLAGYDSFGDKIVIDPFSVYKYRSGLSKEEFESTLKHELTHNELGDSEPSKAVRDLYIQAKKIQGNSDQLVSQSPNIVKKLEDFFQTEKGQGVDKAYEEASQDRFDLAKAAGLSKEEIDLLEKASDLLNKQNVFVDKIQKTKNGNDLPALDEGLGWAVSGQEPDFSIYATKDTPKEMYDIAFSICKSLLKKMPYEKVVEVVKNTMNRSYREGKNAVELLKEEKTLSLKANFQ